MKNLFRLLIGLIVLVGVMVASPPFAGAVMFTFDAVGSISAISAGASSSTIQTYMNDVLALTPGSGTVTVTGALGQSGLSYTGDGHVVGPVINGSPTSATLGNTNGATWVNGQLHQNGVLNSNLNTLGSFITTNYNTGATTITMTFTVAVTSVSFDYEIFPNGTCPSSGNCGTSDSNWPDFTFEAGATAATAVTVFTQQGLVPGTSGTPSGSPAMPGGETAPQFLGVSGTISFTTPVYVLEFIDWPAAIGIDNLCINCDVPVPEPSGLVLLGAGLVGLGFGAWRRRRSPS